MIPDNVSSLQYVSNAIIRHANRLGVQARQAARIHGRWMILLTDNRWIYFYDISKEVNNQL